MRGIPRKIVEHLLSVSGERFEYETRVLIYSIEKNIRIRETTIETIYYDNNSGTNFNPILDSLKIYGVIFSSFIKYILASFSSFLIDVTLFSIFITILLFLGVEQGYWLILSAIFLARIISNLYSFWVNKKYIFKSATSIKTALFRYGALSIALIIASSLGVYIIWRVFGGAETIIKIFLDTILFFANYTLKRKWVFNENKK